MYYIKVVHSGNIQSDKKLSPEITAQLDKIPAGMNFCAALALFPNQAVGSAIALDYGFEGKWQLKSVYVAPKFRKIGIARALIKRLEEEITKRGAEVFFAVFPQDGSAAAPTRSLLETAGFEPPEHAVTVYRSLCADLCEIPWIRQYPLKELYGNDSTRQGDFEIFRWNLLNESDIRYLEENKGKEYPVTVNPLARKECVREDLSFGIRHMGKLAGWAVTEYYGGEELFFRASFLNEAYRGTKLYVAVFATIMQLQKAAGIKYTSTHVEARNRSMQRFMKHALEDRFESVLHELRMARKLTRPQIRENGHNENLKY